MARVFISYDHEDQVATKRIVDALAREGLEVWWDHQIPPGRTWDEVIGARIDAADVVLVVWSRQSVDSSFVKEEAQLAQDARKLLPILVDDAQPPVGFRRMQAANLIGWQGGAENRQWQLLVSEIRARLDAPAAPRQARAQRPSRPDRPGRVSPRVSVKAMLAGGAVLIAIVAAFVALTSTEPDAPVLPAPSAAEAKADEPAAIEAEPAAIDPRQADLNLWRACCARDNAGEGDYRDYLAQFPRGEFASQARVRVRAIEAARAPPRTPSLAGQIWGGLTTRGDGTTYYTRVIFHANGTARFSNERTGAIDGGPSWVWSQSGDRVTFGYEPISWHTGSIDGNIITGSVERQQNPDPGRTFRCTREQ